MVITSKTFKYIVYIVYYMKYASLSVDEHFSHMAIFIHYDVQLKRHFRVDTNLPAFESKDMQYITPCPPSH